MPNSTTDKKNTPANEKPPANFTQSSISGYAWGLLDFGAIGVKLIELDWYKTLAGLFKKPPTTPVSLTGTDDDERLIGGTGDDTLNGLAGNDTLDGGAGSDVLDGGEGHDFLVGGGGSNVLSGGAGKDSLLGGSGNDQLDGGEGDDILFGGAGNDLLDGGSGNDTYLFGSGFGDDTLNAYDSTANKQDVIQFDHKVRASDVTVRRDGDALLLTVKGSTPSSSLRVTDYFVADASGGYQIEKIKFADGTSWDVNAIKSKVLVASGGNDTLTGYASADSISAAGGNDVVHAHAGNDTIDGGDGRDQLYGEDGNDLLKGGAQDDLLDGGNGADSLLGGGGRDSLYGGLGADTLDGGNGNDLLVGGLGNDTYLFGRGSGQDTINSYDGTPKKLDVVRLGAQVLTSNVTLSREDHALLLSIQGGTDTLRIADFFSDSFETSGYQIDQLQFADGTVWDADTIKALLLTGTDGDDTLIGYETDDTLSGMGGNDILYGRDGNDLLDSGEGDTHQLFGGDGDDSLYGGGGEDTLDGGAGNDQIDGGAGVNTVLFGRGYGQDTLSNRFGSHESAIQLGEGLSASDVTLRRNDASLTLSISDSDDQLTIGRYFSDLSFESYNIGSIQFADGTVWNTADIQTQILAATSGNDSIVGSDEDESIRGLAGDDLLLGMYGDDTLDGGAGNDTLIGGYGSDTYLFGKGSGHDVIGEVGNDNFGGADTQIQLGAGIATSQVTLTRKGNSLVIALKGDADSLVVTDYYRTTSPDEGRQFIPIHFADGSTWRVDEVNRHVLATNSNDTVIGSAAADTLQGLAGDDVIYGLAGNDTLDGGAGNDLLDGGAGNDTYLFNKGSGQDSIFAFDGIEGRSDAIQFGAKITAADLSSSLNEDGSLTLSLKGSTDSLTILNFSDPNFQVQTARFADGTVWDLTTKQYAASPTPTPPALPATPTSAAQPLLVSRADSLVSAMAAFAPPAAGDTPIGISNPALLNALLATDWK